MKQITKLTNFSYRNITKEALDKIFIIEKQNFINPWSLEQFNKNLKQKTTFAKVLLIDNIIVAYVFFMVVIDQAEILNITVDKKHQGLGIAKKLLVCCENDLKKKNICKLFLEVRKSNLFAIKLYISLKFIQYSLREKYYQNGEDALLLTKNL